MVIKELDPVTVIIAITVADHLRALYKNKVLIYFHRCKATGITSHSGNQDLKCLLLLQYIFGTVYL